MSEPGSIAESVEEVVPGLVWRWSVEDERIDFESDAHAVAADGGVVLIDPLPLARQALAGLGHAVATCLTAGCHQRSSWRYRAEQGTPVWAPLDAFGLEQEPDEVYHAGDELPGGLAAVHAPGPERPHFALLLERDPGVLFCPDLVANGPGGLAFVPGEYQEDPAETRRSLRRLLELPFAVLCLDHGPPVLEEPKAALYELLERDATDA